MMGDSINLILIKADFTNLEHIKGTLVLKCSYRDVISVDVHRGDAARLRLQLVRQGLRYKSSLDLMNNGMPGSNFLMVDRAALGAKAEQDAL